MAATDVVDAYLAGEPELRARRLAHGEWGITVPAATLDGEALDVGLRIADGLLRAQAMALPSAAEEFAALVERYPVNDYAHFCLGRSLEKTGRRLEARRHAVLAAGGRPDRAV